MSKPELQLATNEKTDKKPADPAKTDIKIGIVPVEPPAVPKKDGKKPEAEVRDAAADDEDALDEEGEGETKTVGVDAIKNETLNILRDLIELSRTPKTATASTAK